MQNNTQLLDGITVHRLLIMMSKRKIILAYSHSTVSQHKVSLCGS